MKWFKLLVCFFFANVSIKTYGQNNCPPPNIGFEDGTFNHWELMSGLIDKQGNFNLKPTGPLLYRQTLVDKNYLPKYDQYGKFPTLCPNGSGHSIILGNTSGADGQTEGAFYTFTIPAGASQYSLTFNYAVVSGDNYAIPKLTRPSFQVKVFDISDSTYIDCASYYFAPVPQIPLPVWKTNDRGSAVLEGNWVYYQDWTIATINLNHLTGKKLRLEFTTNHSAPLNPNDPSSNYCYAYVDVNEGCAPTITGNTYCTGQTGVTLQAPPGLGTYYWYKADDFTKRIGVGQILSISPAPADNTKYALISYTQNGFVCPDTLYTIVNKNSANFSFKTRDTLYACLQSVADLTASAVTAGSSTGLTYSYFNDAACTMYLYQPDAISTSGTYYIKATNQDGCTNTLPVTIIVLDNKAIHITNPPAVIFPKTVDITATFAHLNNFTYKYYLDNSVNNLISNPQQITKSGTYYIQALEKVTGCSIIAPVNVIINPPASAIIKAFNTFTPNNDGINDYFFITITGYASFEWLTIYNRYGQIVFKNKSINGYWDGNINGKPASAGTYYWLFQGTDTYNHQMLYHAGFITLIR